MQVYVQTLKDAPRPCCRQDCGPKEAFFLKVKADRAVTAGRKSYCTKEGCSSNAFVYSSGVKQGEEVHFSEGLSSGVYLRGYTKRWSDVSS